MAKIINTLDEALAFKLQILLECEKKIAAGFHKIISNTTSARLCEMLKAYEKSANDKLLKVRGTFSYLSSLPCHIASNVIDELINDACYATRCVSFSRAKDTLLFGFFHQIIYYKMAAYNSAFIMSIELELDGVSKPLQDILAEERDTDRKLMGMAFSHFNKLQDQRNFNLCGPE